MVVGARGMRSGGSVPRDRRREWGQGGKPPVMMTPAATRGRATGPLLCMRYFSGVCRWGRTRHRGTSPAAPEDAPDASTLKARRTPQPGTQLHVRPVQCRMMGTERGTCRCTSTGGAPTASATMGHGWLQQATNGVGFPPPFVLALYGNPLRPWKGGGVRQSKLVVLLESLSPGPLSCVSGGVPWTMVLGGRAGER